MTFIRRIVTPPRDARARERSRAMTVARKLFSDADGGFAATASSDEDGGARAMNARRFAKDDDDDGDEDHPVAYPPVNAPTDEYDVLVCHANVIRFFALRALQLPPEGWLRLCTMNCSVTHVTISPDGKVSLRSLGDTGHLSVDEVTFGTYTGTNW